MPPNSQHFLKEHESEKIFLGAVQSEQHPHSSELSPVKASLAAFSLRYLQEGMAVSSRVVVQEQNTQC